VNGTPRRGEVWWCELPEVGRRPVVVLSRDAAIPRLRRALVAPCTTTIRGLASEVVLEPGDDPVPRRSAVNLDSVESVSIGVLVHRLGALSAARMRDLCVALEVAVDCAG
jgi:mRNA interferase MazF